MNDKIKQMYALLKTKGKDNVRATIAREYNKSFDYVKNHWILKGTIPEEYQQDVIDVLEGELKKEIEEVEKILAK